MAAAVKNRKLLNTREASEYLGGRPTRRTLEDWRKEGRGPLFLNMDGFILYDPDELDRWKESKVVHPSEVVA